MKILIAAGALKHSLSATAAAQAIAHGLDESGLAAALTLMPMADGGNGTLDAFLVNGGERRTQTVRDPLGRPVEAAFGLLPDSATAVIEMALASGLELLQPHELDPLTTTTYGTGQLMAAALEAGARRIIVGMGGSATVDGGAGCLQALGVRLLDADGAEISPGGGHLHRIATIDASGLAARWRDVDVLIASDVENPTLGGNGAAAVFGPQKGATPEQVEILEDNLRHFFDLVETQLGVSVQTVQSGGCAGAFGAGLMAFLGGRIESGIDLILDANRFDEQVQDADLVITSEGQIDTQTIEGKGPIGVARRAQRQGVPTVALVGGLNAPDTLLHDAGMWAVLPIVTRPMPLTDALADADNLMRRAALRLGYLLQIARRD